MRVRWLYGWFESQRGRGLAALFCLGLMLVAINVVAEHIPPVRLDLTAERLYTLSSDTRRILAAIDEPLTLRLYYSARSGAAVPALGRYAERVRRLLAEYVATAGGKLRLEVYDPPPFSEAEARAAAFGLESRPLGPQGEPFYFGLAATNSTDDRQTIAFFEVQRERRLEYDLTRLVRNLILPDAADASGNDTGLSALRRRGTQALRLELLDRVQRAADARYAAARVALEARLDTDESKWRDLTVGEAEAPLSPEDAKAVDRLRADMRAARRELGAAQAASRRGVVRLQAAIEFCDAALVPIIVAAAAITVGALRRRRSAA